MIYPPALGHAAARRAVKQRGIFPSATGESLFIIFSDYAAMKKSPRVISGPPPWGGFILLVVCAFFVAFLFYSPDSKAHYDFDPEQDRHYYHNAYNYDSDTPQGAAEHYAVNKTVSGNYIVLDLAPIVVSGCTARPYRWSIKVGTGSGYETCSFLEEMHCDYDEKSVEGVCVTRSDHCAAAKDTYFTWDIPIGSDSYGINVPNDITESPFSSWAGCSMRKSSVTTHTNYLTATYIVLGDFHLDNDHALQTHSLFYASENPIPGSTDFANCVPPAVDTATGEAVEDWGQSGACGIPEPPAPDNDGSDDGDIPADDPVDTDTTNPGNEGVEERLDILVDEQEKQTGILRDIDSELDELDTNTERTASATERTANASEGILAEMQDDAASGGGTCDAEPICTGDPIACEQLKQQWLQRCGMSQTQIGDMADTFDAEADAELQGALDGIQTDIQDGVGTHGDELEGIGQDFKNAMAGFLPSPQACTNFEMNILGHSHSMSCELFDKFKVAFGWFLSLMAIAYIWSMATKPVDR